MSWRETSLGEVLTVRHGKSQRAVESPSGRYPVLATGGRIGWSRIPLYSKPSVLIGRKGTIDRPQYQDSPFWTVDTLFYTELTKSVDPRFIYYIFQTIDWRSMNEASGVPSLSSSRIENIRVKLPSLDEQIVIREALDDADNLIVNLERLITKKQAIKTGMMQQLLTGRVRLRGFSGPWQAKRLSEVLTFQVGFPFPSSHFTDSPTGARLVRNRDLRSDDSKIYYSGKPLSEYVLAKGDVVVGMDGEFEPVVWREEGSLLNQRVGRLRVTSAARSLYLSYALVEPLRTLQGATGATTVKHLSHRDVEKMILALPTREEQDAIAIALADADLEISSLTVKLAKARAIKQGMMQQLLTGRTRLHARVAS